SQLKRSENDNFQVCTTCQPEHAQKAPKFEENFNETVKTKKKKTRCDHFKQRFRKNFAALLEEEAMLATDELNYLSARAPSSKMPERKFCAVCGFPSNYTCVNCGTRYCCVRCLGTHQDTRCQIPFKDTWV
ncbi:PREDICTED: zinc finger HIT domain-containing protein 1-like, partial [Priapulus caudatus]|uniref:Zinc finger HIT domain-containing protein 1-like n=1 Tax=Priapulus caudatus TaxID=37621 RepID=A0ABM1E5X6_PRICU